MNDNFFNNPGKMDLGSSPVQPDKRAVTGDSNVRRAMHDGVRAAAEEPVTMDGGKDFLELLSTHFLICNDKIIGNGEDCGYEAYTSEAGIMGAFDGCGGLGAKSCSAASDKTEAYMASRTVGAAVRDWFYSCLDNGCRWDVEALRSTIISKLEFCQKHAGDPGPKLRGSMVRPFPSTVAMIAAKVKNGRLLTHHIWAGDSRTYVLDKNGLGQISRDDIKGEDAMSNLTKDGALTNVISSDGRFVLHSAEFAPRHPCILFCASDGCFGYVSSPMEFEMMILGALEKAASVAQWQHLLDAEIAGRAGDDQTIAVAAFGFRDFSELKSYFMDRYLMICRIVQEFGNADPDGKQLLWESYRPGYYRYAANKE